MTSRAMRRAAWTAALLVVCLATVLAAKKPPAAPHPISDAVAVSGCSDCETWPPHVTSGAGDEVLVGWHGLHDDLHVTLDRFGADGALADRVGTISSSEFLEFLGTMRDGDGWVVGWRVANQTLLRRFDAGGAAGQAAMLALETPAGRRDRGMTFAARDGRVLAAWERLESEDVVNSLLVAWFDAGGGRLSEPTAFGESFGLVGNRACVRPDGSAVVVFALLGEPPLPFGFSPTGVAVRRVDADGSPLGAVALITPPSTNARGRYFDVACAADGSFAVAWNTSTTPAKKGIDVVWQRFDAAGKARGKAQLLASSLDGDQIQPRLLVRRDGSVLAVWLSHEAASDRIMGRRFSGAGKALAKDFALHAGAAGALDLPSAALGEGSHFALGWWENRRGLLRWFGD